MFGTANLSTLHATREGLTSHDACETSGLVNTDMSDHPITKKVGFYGA